MSDDEAGGADAPAPVVSIIANPLADAKLAKKVLKVVKKGARRAAAGPQPPQARAPRRAQPLTRRAAAQRPRPRRCAEA
jgi:hypothetical protein